MPNLQNFKGSSFCRSLGRSLGPKLRPNQDSVDLCLQVKWNNYLPLFSTQVCLPSWPMFPSHPLPVHPMRQHIPSVPHHSQRPSISSQPYQQSWPRFWYLPWDPAKSKTNHCFRYLNFSFLTQLAWKSLESVLCFLKEKRGKTSDLMQLLKWLIKAPTIGLFVVPQSWM